MEGKEAALWLLRSIAKGERAEWLKSVVLLVNPIYNADGNEKVNLRNRGRQNGPVGGMGQRANGQNLDLNRDCTKLEIVRGAVARDADDALRPPRRHRPAHDRRQRRTAST